MSGVFVINQILDNIVKGGKQIIKDKCINRQKVPPYTSRRVDLLNMESVIHGGYKQEPTSRNGFFSLKKDTQPKNASPDGLGSTRAHIDKQKIVNNKAKNAKVNRSEYRRTNFSGIKSSRYKSGGFSPVKSEINKSKQKQNCFIKLEEDNKNRIIIERVKIRQSIQQDKLRTEKQKMMFKQYQQRKVCELFDREKIQKQQSGRKQFKQHIGKGQDHSFAFDDQGQPIYFKKQQNLFSKNYPYSVDYKFESEEDFMNLDHPVIDEKIFTKRKYTKRPKAKNQSEYFQTQQKINEHQRIRSARGQAFSSSVLKTVNLSRISINQSLREIQVEQFMKRNDLFNNNHTRQTTSIPYLQPKVGTVYTELSTNQIIGDNNLVHQKVSDLNNSQTTKSRHFERRKSHFQPYRNQNFSEDSKSLNIFADMGKFNPDDHHKIETRPLRTADGYTKRSLNSERRPKTSVHKGRITTANEGLVIALIQ